MANKNISPVKTGMTLTEYVNSKIATTIETIDLDAEIEELQEVNENINQDVLEESFDILKENIATSKNAALNENYTNISENYEQYWTDNKLKFTKANNGTYLIEQQDENGNWVAMGYTTEKIAHEYLNKINELNNNSQSQSVGEKESLIQKEVRETVDEVASFNEYIKNMALSNDAIKEAYENLSDDAKRYINIAENERLSIAINGYYLNSNSGTPQYTEMPIEEVFK